MTYKLGGSNRHPQSIEGRKNDTKQRHYHHSNDLHPDSNRHPQSIEGRKSEQQTHYNRDTTLTVMTYKLGGSNRHPQSIEGRKGEQQTH